MATSLFRAGWRRYTLDGCGRILAVAHLAEMGYVVTHDQLIWANEEEALPQPWRGWLDAAVPLPGGVVHVARRTDWARVVAAVLKGGLALVLAGALLVGLQPASWGLAVLGVAFAALAVWGWQLWKRLRFELGRDSHQRYGLLFDDHHLLMRVDDGRIGLFPLAWLEGAEAQPRALGSGSPYGRAGWLELNLRDPQTGARHTVRCQAGVLTQADREVLGQLQRRMG